MWEIFRGTAVKGTKEYTSKHRHLTITINEVVTILFTFAACDGSCRVAASGRLKKTKRKKRREIYFLDIFKPELQCHDENEVESKS